MTEHDAPFDPEANIEDATALRNAKRLKMATQHLDQQGAMQAQKQFLDNTFNEALVEAGIDVNTYNQLIQSDPNANVQILKEVFREGTRKIVQENVARARNAKGQFVKQPAQPQGQPQRQAQPQQGNLDILDRSVPRQFSNQNTQDLKARVDKGYVPNEEELIDSLDGIFD